MNISENFMLIKPQFLCLKYVSNNFTCTPCYASFLVFFSHSNVHKNIDSFNIVLYLIEKLDFSAESEIHHRQVFLKAKISFKNQKLLPCLLFKQNWCV